jgi:phosphatidylserine/phosphatidylglycerophosphate/cardiolipin synthase-like enzyme
VVSLDEKSLLILAIIVLAAVVIGGSFGSDIASQYIHPAQPGNYTSTVVNQSITTQFQTVTISAVCGGDLEVLDVCYSPGGNCAAVIQKYFDNAQKTIYVAIYSFTLDNLADSLVKAKLRGVIVQVVFDKVQVNIQGSQYDFLIGNGVQVRIDRTVSLMHDKMAIIDSSIVVTGSYNWSNNAENSNRENLIVIRSVTIANEYKEQWQIIWDESTE